jgi:N-methylhydantoinase B
MQSIVDEAGAALVRTAFSHIVREAKDFACAILTADGSTVSQSSQSIPVFLGTMTHTVRELLRRFPLDSLEPGDIVATNDPWLGTGHLFDLTVLAPVVVDGERVAVAAVVAHLPDIGGRGFSVDSRDAFEEGLRVPPLKIVVRGQLEPWFVAMLLSNVRMPDQVLGDLHAILNACAVICGRLEGLCRDMSVARFRSSCQELEQRTEARLRASVAALPDGRYESTIESGGVAGYGFKLHAAIEIRHESILVDFAGSSDQIPVAINSCFSYTRAYTFFAIKCMLAPRVAFNEGISKPIEVIAPEGSILNSRPPAAGAARNLVGHFIPTLIFNALAAVAPKQVIADCGSPRPILNITGVDGRGEHFSAPILVMGGFGARASSDGPSCLAFPTNTETVPIEMLESTCPLRVEEKRLLADSGGPGRFRGGLGQRVTVRLLSEQASASVLAQRLGEPPRGALGGGDGGATRIVAGETDVKQLAGSFRLGRGDTISVDSPGGGGYGSPELRERALVAEDVRDGYVSFRQAASEYGWHG